MHSWFHAWIDAKLEGAVVNQCDRIVLASPAWKDTFVRRYGEGINHKLVVITNGFEEEFVSRVARTASSRHHERVRFLLTGSMHAAESPAPFFQALANLQSRWPDLAARVEVRLIGQAGDNIHHLQRLARDTGIGDRIAFLGPRSNDECLVEQAESDVLLLFSALEHKDTICGKSFEYMANGKPILACVSPQGAQADILRPAGTAVIVTFGDVEATTAALVQLLDDPNRVTHPNWPYISQFDRRVLTAKLAGVLSELVSSSPRPPARTGEVMLTANHQPLCNAAAGTEGAVPNSVEGLSGGWR
jgi:glycosyltransferase involved in cell wall biosynthesis